MNNEITSFLYARPSLIEGISRTIDMGCTLEEYNTSPDGMTADQYALYADWLATSEDMRRAFIETAQQFGINVTKLAAV